GAIEPAARKNGRPRPGEVLLAGELALDGRVRPIRGAISLAQLARERGFRGVVVPRANAAEAAAVGAIEVCGVETLGEVAAIFNGQCRLEPHPFVDIESLIAHAKPKVDFGEVRGQEAAKRALTIAAAGAHNVLMLGPAGTGETVALTASGHRRPSARSRPDPAARA
ncbi:MAG: ATP-binding protein, partial [Planctomycetota bacterium]